MVVFTVSEVVQLASTSPVTVGVNGQLLPELIKVAVNVTRFPGGEAAWSAVAGTGSIPIDCVHPFDVAFPPHDVIIITAHISERPTITRQLIGPILVLGEIKMQPGQVCTFSGNACVSRGISPEIS
jgi:hypothetical protein